MSATSVTTDPVALIRFCNAARILAQCCTLPCGELQQMATLCHDSAGDGNDDLAHALRELGDQLRVSDADDFIKCYARLFLGPFTVLVPPYASWFLEEDQQMMGPVAQSVAEAYADAGLGPSDGPRELPDHIGLELEFCYLLGYRVIEQQQQEATQRLDQFWQGHLSQWLPQLADAIEKHAEHPALHAVGVCLRTLAAHGPHGHGSN